MVTLKIGKDTMTGLVKKELVMMNKELLDQKFRELFKDKSQTGFSFGDHIYIKMIRNETLRSSFIEVYVDGEFWYNEKLGRFKTYKWFLNSQWLNIRDRLRKYQ